MGELTRLGRFEIRRELGKGAMGIVYEGHDPMIDRTVALKTIRAAHLQGAEAQDHLARFRREAQAAGRLSHPNIVAIYDFGEDDGTTFIAMEFVKGRELQALMEAGERFAMHDVVHIMGQLLDALGYSHAHGVIHRDIKPSNIIILEDGTVKVADFGIAHLESSSLTQTGTLLGTPSYMSPEQFTGQAIDGRSDLFSAGVILYQLLTGEKPFTGSVTTIMHKVLQEQPLPPSTLNGQAPRAFDAVMRRALAKRPDERYQSAAEFLQAIRQAAQPVAAGPAGPPLIDLDVTLVTAAGTVVQAPAAAGRASEPTQRLHAGPAGLGAGSLPAAAGSPEVAVAAAPAPSAGAARSTSAPTLALVGVVVLVCAAIGTGWFVLQRPARTVAGAASPGSSSSPAASLPATAPAVAAAPAAAQPAALPAVAAALPVEPGTIVVDALGLADPSDARYQGDAAALAAGARADAHAQAVAKAIGLYLQQASLAQHYERLRDTVLARSGDYIASVVRESPATPSQDGLTYVSTQALVKSRELQKALNEMSRSERIVFIRTNGNPKVAVRVTTRDADRPDSTPQASAVAENLLKERIKSFGFRTWSEDAGAAASGAKAADFIVLGEARIRKLSVRLEASGLTISKFTLSSWTVKCVDRASGEEVYFNSVLPKGGGSWASEEEALAAIGARLADEFNRDFFLQHFGMTGQRVVLRVAGLADPATADLMGRELISLATVLSSATRPGQAMRAYDLVLAGSGSAQEQVASGILAPLNAKFGAACFALGSGAGAGAGAGVAVGDAVDVMLAPRCEPTLRGRLESAPPAGLYAAPASRQRAVVKDPEVLKKLQG